MRMKTFHQVMKSAFGLLLIGAALITESNAAQSEYHFFAFDNGLEDIEPAEEKAELLKELGYDGICWRPHEQDQAMLAALDEHGLSMSATYVVLHYQEGACQVPQQVVEHIERLAGRETIIWLTIRGEEEAQSDPIVVEAINQVADLAKESGLKVSLYPHIRFYTDTVAKCFDLVKQVDRDDVGISFNLCHYLAQSDHDQLEETIRTIAPKLMVVQINGAKQGTPGETSVLEFIQPLGEGGFDVWRVMRVLQEIGYQGPIGLQCYAIDEPAEVHLKKSMDAWQAYLDRSSNQ